jgi:hypothetical protein
MVGNYCPFGFHSFYPIDHDEVYIYPNTKALKAPVLASLIRHPTRLQWLCRGVDQQHLMYATGSVYNL